MKNATVKLRGNSINVHCPGNVEEMQAGADAFPPLTDDKGLLFLFVSDEPKYIAIVRRRDPIDVLWLVDRKVKAACTLTQGIVWQNATEVLELRPGWAQQHGVRLGDEVEIQWQHPEDAEDRVRV